MVHCKKDSDLLFLLVFGVGELAVNGDAVVIKVLLLPLSHMSMELVSWLINGALWC